MINYIKRLLLRFLQDDIYKIDAIEIDKLRDWLNSCHTSSGFKHYYTLRKKNLMSLLALDVKNVERYKVLGRLEELKALSTNINTEFKRRIKEQAKKKKIG